MGLGSVMGVARIGLQVQPGPFLPPAPGAASQEAVALPANMPPPVVRYVGIVLGDRVPVVGSVALTGRGRLRVSGVSFLARWRFTYTAGRDYRHEIECTWFGTPILRVNEIYRDGHLRQELPVGVVANEPKADQAANLALWGEQLFWLPSGVVTDPRVRWEAIDATRARLIVPFGPTEDSFTVTFDEGTGLIRRVEALRYKSPTDAAKTPWLIDALAWRSFNGIRLPSAFSVTWQDEGTPWLEMTVEDVANNVDVSSSFGASGP